MRDGLSLAFVFPPCLGVCVGFLSMYVRPFSLSPHEGLAKVAGPGMTVCLVIGEGRLMESKDRPLAAQGYYPHASAKQA